MTYENYIDIQESFIDKPIYRIMPIRRLLEVLQKKQLCLAKPKTWGDPFENLLLTAPLKWKDGGGPVNVRADVYGLCWTWHKETDGMWRIYSSDEQGVKVKTTPRKLLDALKAHDPTWQERCFIGNVKYESQKKLLSSLEKVDLRGSAGVAKSLLLKRKAFSHEKEVRLIYSPDKNHISISDIHSFEVSPNELFEEIIFDPRMDKELADAYKFAIESKGYPKLIKRSDLYQLPKGLTFTI